MVAAGQESTRVRLQTHLRRESTAECSFAAKGHNSPAAPRVQGTVRISSAQIYLCFKSTFSCCKKPVQRIAVGSCGCQGRGKAAISEAELCSSQCCQMNKKKKQANLSPDPDLESLKDPNRHNHSVKRELSHHRRETLCQSISELLRRAAAQAGPQHSPFMYSFVVSTISWYTTNSGSSLKRTELGWMNTGSSRSAVCEEAQRLKQSKTSH